MGQPQFVNKITVLLTDDDSALTRVLRANLEQGDFRVLEANNGMDCIHIVTRENVDMLFLDVRLPDFSGWGILGLFRFTESLRHIPVMLSSGDPPNKRLTEMLKPDCFLAKPFDIRDFITKVTSLVEVRPGQCRRSVV